MREVIDLGWACAQVSSNNPYYVRLVLMAPADSEDGIHTPASSCNVYVNVEAARKLAAAIIAACPPVTTANTDEGKQ